MKKNIIGCMVLAVIMNANAGENLNAARGKIFKVNFSQKCFELLKATDYDPKTQESKSKHTVYWTDKTKFTKTIDQPDFKGIKSPVVTVFYYLDKNATQAIRDGKSFKSRFADVYPESKKASGLGKDGRKFVSWFTPNTKSHKFLGGSVEIKGKKVTAALTGRRSLVRINTQVAPEILNNRFFKTRIYGRNINGKFVIDHLNLSPLVDPRTVDDPKLPRVLIVGDSISMNYHNAAKAALKGKANYYRIEGNGGPSNRGVTCMELWLGDYKTKGFHWDVILFNHGLHDLKQPEKNGKYGKHQVSIKNYEKNLEKEINILKKTGAKLIWCSITPVPNSSKGMFGRRKDEDLVYNKAALRIVSKYPEIQVLDLNKVVRNKKVFDNWRKGTNVHFKTKEQNVLGAAVAKAILKALKK